MPIKLNFTDDLNRILSDELLREWNFDTTAESIYDVPLIYCNAALRKIRRSHRTFHSSASLSCPDEFRNGFTNLQRAIVEGEDLLPYQSRLFAKPDEFDELLTDWGIHHFHLGDELEPDGIFVKRTGPLLFALLRDDSFYGIEILPHGSWTDGELIETIHKNWPSLIVHAKMPQGTQSLNLSSQARRQLRKKNCNAPITLRDGTNYMAIGGGYTGSGHNVQARIRADKMIAEVQALENKTKENSDQILQNEGIDSESINAELVITDSGLRVRLVELNKVLII